MFWFKKMLKLFNAAVILFCCSSVFAQNSGEFEILINGNQEKVALGKKYKFITPKGDTIVYSVDDIIKEMLKNQPKKNEKAVVTEDENTVNEDELSKQEMTETQQQWEQSENDIELIGKQEQDETMVRQKLLAEKIAFENAQKEKEELNRKMIEEQKMIEDKKEKELKYRQWVDSLERAEKIEEMEKVEEKPVVTEDTKQHKAVDAAEIERLKEEERQKVKEKTNSAANKNDVEIMEAVERKDAVAITETEEKKTIEIISSRYEFKKYFVADQNINAANFALQDTVKLIRTDLSAYKDFPNIQFGTENSISLCYDYVINTYHGYNEELAAKYTTRYKVCQVGKWSEENKTAEVYVDTKEGRIKLQYTIAQLDDSNLVIVKQ